MSLPRRYPFLIVGDKDAQLMSWRLFPQDSENRALDDSNTDGGRLYIAIRSSIPSAPPPPTPPTSPAPDAGTSVVNQDRASGVLSDGADAAVITVTVLDATSVPIQGQNVGFALSGPGAAGAFLEPDNVVTDANGEAQARLRSTTAGLVTVTATVDPGGSPVVITDTAAVTFATAAVISTSVVLLFKDPDRLDVGELMALGVGKAGSRVQLYPWNNSSVRGSVWMANASPTEGVELWVAIATPDFIRGREDRFDELKLEDPLEVSDFENIRISTLRRLYLEIQARFPPYACVGDALSSTGKRKQQGKFGDFEDIARRLWRVNNERTFELAGLQNPGDWLEWAITYGRRLAWERRRRGGQEDQVAQLIDDLEKQAEKDFDRVWPWVDVGADGDADRIVQRKNLRFRRS